MKYFLVFAFFFAHCVGLAQQQQFNEPYRPQFHFTPPAKWMNDPNGLVYFNGKYHLFYQYYPDSTVWGPMHWGHAESKDLIRWQHLPIALYPDSLGWIFSGSAVIDKDNTAGFGKNAMIAIFTYHNDVLWKKGQKNVESQGLAYSTDEGRTWKKYVGNPVLNNSGEQDFRDPKVFWYEKQKKWVMTLAAGDKIKLFSSINLKNWSFESDFQPKDDAVVGVWECPDLFPLMTNDKGEKWVLIVNHDKKAPNGGSGTRYFVGSFDGKTFVTEQVATWLDYGTDFYAGVTFDNVPQNKRILMAWLSNWQYAQQVPTQVWRSAMTLPRQLGLVKQGTQWLLKQSLLPDYQQLEKPIFTTKKATLPFSKEQVDYSQASFSFEVISSEGLKIILSNNKGEKYVVEITNDALIADRSLSGQITFSEKFAPFPQKMPLNGGVIRKVKVIIDKSSVEILLNDGEYSFTNLIFPTAPYSALQITSSKHSSIENIYINSVKGIWGK